MLAVPSWSDFAAAAPELAAAVRARLDGHPYKLIATLRKDGSPRVSGIEVDFDGGELRAGSMPGSLKVADLERDGRFALHGAPAPPDEWTGDAKLAGIAHPTTGPQPGARYFRLDVREASTVEVREACLVITVWTPAGGVRSWTR